MISVERNDLNVVEHRRRSSMAVRRVVIARTSAFGPPMNRAYLCPNGGHYNAVETGRASSRRERELTDDIAI